MSAAAPFSFYAAEISYFSAKVRPALRYKAVPYVEKLPTRAAYRDVIVPRTGLAFIPIVITPEDETWQDTSEILDALEARVPDPPLYPRSPLLRAVSLLFELYADEFLVLPAMHYRWSFPESEAKARADFGSITGDPESASRFADRMKGSIAALGVSPASIPGIEAHLGDLLRLLEAHFASHAYLLGARMSLADCSLMGPLYAHLYLDAVPGRLLRASAPRVCHWIERMNHPDPAEPGAWIAGGELPESLLELLALIGRDAGPVLQDTLRAFEAWADARPPGQEELPRAVGFHQTILRGVAFQRYTSPYSMWMAQRSWDPHRALAPAERARVERGLAGTGCEALLAWAPRHRVAKRRFKLVLES
ncbi:MAG: glutathione S-transferase family protein [Candidatus Limnocylindria bacterium]